MNCKSGLRIIAKICLVCVAVVLVAARAGGADEPAGAGAIPDLMRSADQAAKNRDYSTCAQLLEQVVALDANYKNALNYLGWTYNALGQYMKAEAILRRAVAVNPADAQAYNNLGQALAYQRKYDEAVEQYLKQIAVTPKDPWAHANLGRTYLGQKKYAQALAELQIAAGISPNDASILFNQGRAYAKVNEPEKALAAFRQSAKMQPVANRWNSVAYAMAEDKLDLAGAKRLTDMAIAATTQQMRETSLDHLGREDVYAAARLAAIWDTMGWVDFQAGDLAEAEKYLRSAWLVLGTAAPSEHLAELYEKQGKKAESVKYYEAAVSGAVPEELKARALAAAGPDAKIDAMAEEGRAFLKESRSLEIENARKGDGWAEGLAEFWVLLSPGPKVQGVKFATGDEELRVFEKELAAAKYPEDLFPEATEIRLLRRGRLTCLGSAPRCKFVLQSVQVAAGEELAASVPSVAGGIERIRIGGNVAAAKIIKKVDPAYPEFARRERISGAVRLHAIIAKDGTIKNVDVLSGPQELVKAAVEAVRQWVYQPTLLEGHPVEVDTTIEVYFNLR